MIGLCEEFLSTVHWCKLGDDEVALCYLLRAPSLREVCYRAIHVRLASKQQLLGRRQSRVQYLRCTDRPVWHSAPVRSPAYSRARTVRSEAIGEARRSAAA